MAQQRREFLIVFILSSTTAPVVTANAFLISFFQETPFNPGAIFVYLLMAGCVGMVLYFGLKKPKGPGNMGNG